MDVITNFHAATDAIDLTGLGVALKYAGKLKPDNIGGNSLGWQASGGNTFVYVNNPGGTEKLAAADIKIELPGAPSLASGNFAHL
jgi:hypothetical protein